LKFLSVSLLILITDQLSKFYVKGIHLPFLDFEHLGLPQSRSIPIIDRLFYITPVENPGIAFGIDFGPELKILISIFTILATLGLVVYLFKIKKEEVFIRLSVAVILGGALGNLTDRVFYGYFYGYASILSGSVVDFLDLRLFSFFLMNKTFSTYVFNFADVAITLGVTSLIFAITKKRKETRAAENLGVENSFNVD
jgi:signal peptidase II